MLQRFKEHIQDSFPELLDQPLLIGCSGGIDSVVLTHLCKALRLEIAIAHCNFQLRGNDSDLDAEFVKELSLQLKVPFYETSFATMEYMEVNKTSLQIAARELRYEWFQKLSKETNHSYVLTAHQQNDSLESFFINASRGTGIDGLIGIPEKRGIYRRPLLPFSRAEIEKYASEHSITWREDVSNKEVKYIRNKVRHLLLPEFAKLHPTAIENLLDTLTHLQQEKLFVDTYVSQLRSQIFKGLSGEITIEIKALLELQVLGVTLYKLFIPYGFKDSSAILQLCQSSSGKQLISSTHILLKDRQHLLLKECDVFDNRSFKISENCTEIQEPILLKFTEVSKLVKASNREIYVDKDQLQYPLTLRKYQKGDRIKPYGLGGSKKLSKYFKDEKFSQFKKEAQWLLCDDADRIVWVVGACADRRFQITSSTQSILRISLE